MTIPVKLVRFDDCAIENFSILGGDLKVRLQGVAQRQLDRYLQEMDANTPRDVLIGETEFKAATLVEIFALEAPVVIGGSNLYKEVELTFRSQR